MKRYALILLLFFLMFSTYGCINKNDNFTKASDSSKDIAASQNNSKQSTESENGGSDKDPSASDQSAASLKNNNENFKWPVDFIPGVPEPEGVIDSLFIDSTEVDNYIKGPQFARIELSNMEEQAADRFIDELKLNGYTENAVYEKNSQHTKYYVQDFPTLEKGNRVIFKWRFNDKKAILAMLKPGGAALEWYLMDYFDDTGEEDLSPWPQNFIPSFTEPKGKITNVDKEYIKTSDGVLESNNVNVDFYCGDRQSVIDCIAELRKRYYVEADETCTDSEVSYEGLSEFYEKNGSCFDHALIIYENIAHESIIGDHSSDNRWYTITVFMGKSHSLQN